MLDPFSLLPIAMAARGGRVDEFEAQQLVAAGLTVLQRSAILVRALNGRRAAILCPTSPMFITALAASDGRGAVLVNPLAAPPEVAYQLRDANVGAVFTTTGLADLLPPDVPRVLLDDAPRTARVVAGGRTQDVDLGSHRGLDIEGDLDAAGSDDEALIIYTSAMAGIPLGAVLSHRSVLANARSTVVAAGNTTADRVLALLPFSHLFGLTVTGTAPLLSGATVLTMPRFNPGRAVDLIADGDVTEIVGVPAVYRGLLAMIQRRGGIKAAALRLCICGGSPLSVELQEEWFDATGVELRQGYGLTEAGPVCLFNRVDRPNARGSLGVPLPGVEVDLRESVKHDDEVGAQDATSNRGEICVHGDNVFSGYVSGGERGLAVVDGWLHTGDLGERAEDGHHIVFAGFIKPMFTRNGFNIYPREIERAVGEMPGVESASVRGVDAADREPDIILEVRGRVEPQDVEQWCAARLSAYKQPTSIIVL